MPPRVMAASWTNERVPVGSVTLARVAVDLESAIRVVQDTPLVDVRTRYPVMPRPPLDAGVDQVTVTKVPYEVVITF